MEKNSPTAATPQGIQDSEKTTKENPPLTAEQPVEQKNKTAIEKPQLIPATTQTQEKILLSKASTQQLTQYLEETRTEKIQGTAEKSEPTNIALKSPFLSISKEQLSKSESKLKKLLKPKKTKKFIQEFFQMKTRSHTKKELESKCAVTPTLVDQECSLKEICKVASSKTKHHWIR